MSGDVPRGVARRGFLAVCGAVGSLAGCLAPVAETQPTTSDGTPTATLPETTTTAQSTAAPDRIHVDGDLSWTMAGNGSANTGFTPTQGPQTVPGRVWDVPVEGVFTIPSPAYTDGTLYFGSGTNTYAIDVTEGTRVWTTELDYLAHHYPPAIAGNRILVSARTMQGARAGGGEGVLSALDPEDGTIIWQFPAPVSSGPTVLDDEVYVTSSSGSAALHALDTAGTERWTVDVGHDGVRATSAFRAPAVVGDTVFVTTTIHRRNGTGDGVVVALDRRSGSRRWETRVDAELRAAPLVSDGRLYAAAADGDVHAIETATGDVVWTHGIDTEVMTTPVMDERAVYVLSAGSVVAIDHAGDRIWKTDIGVTRMNGMAVTERGVFVGGSNVTALGTIDGTVRWTYPIPGDGGGYGAPVVLDGVVFTGACIKETPSSLYDDHMFALA